MDKKRNKSGGITGIHLKLNKRNPESTDTIPILPIESIPTTIGQEKLNVLTDGDEDPYFFAQAIQFPVEGNGDVYGEEFFKSFIDRNKEHAFPGDKYGHSKSWCERQPSHFFQVGSIIVDNVAYFKFYVPSETDSESNKSYIKEIKANGIDLSLVAKVKYAYNEDDNKYHMLESVGGERNDAVGFGDGSMDQIVINKEDENIKEGLGMDEILKKLNALILSGELSIPDLMLKLNKSDMLKTDEDKAEIAVLNSLKVELGDKPLEKAKELILKADADAETVREAALESAFGKKLNADGKTGNMVRLQGEIVLGDKEATVANIEAVKANPVFIAIAGELADETSKLNKIFEKKNAGTVGGIKHVKA